jgi:sodium/bile acid cotransporter 7
VAAAVCAASASSLLGVFVTPVLVNLLLHAQVANSLIQALIDLGLQLVLPFALGQFARPLLAAWVTRQKKIIGLTDRLSVLFIVYVSFSHGTTTGIWHNLSVSMFGALVICCAIILAAALFFTSYGGKLLGFSRPDRITITFCGSKKSLITGVPMANIIFSPALASVIILPLMIFHQMQLIACSFLARHFSADKSQKSD